MSAEMSLAVLAHNLKRTINILGTQPLIPLLGLGHFFGADIKA